jgi:hypothetical protein
LFYFLCASVLTMSVRAAAVDPETYKSVSIDQSGALHILLDSGKEVLAPKDKDQAGFDSPQISSDGKTVGWLALFPFPRPDPSDYDPGPIAGSLVLYRDGRILHTFETEQIFWVWHFLRGGSQVAYSTGPTHGGAT